MNVTVIGVNIFYASVSVRIGAKPRVLFISMIVAVLVAGQQYLGAGVIPQLISRLVAQNTCETM
jgi:hypothetical protein